MSFQAQNWAVRIKTGSHVLKAILLQIANYADEKGECYPSQGRLAADLEMGERTVRDALQKLEDKGIITRTRRNGDDGYRTSDLIRLNHTYRQEPPVGPKGQAARDAGKPTGGSRHSYRQEPPGNHQRTTSTLSSLRSERGAPSDSNVVALKRKTRLTEAFQLTPAHLAYAAEHGLSEKDTRHEFEKFQNHFLGSGAVKLDWHRTLLKWLCTAGEQHARQAAHGGGRQAAGSRFAATQRFIDLVQDQRRVRGGREDDEAPLPF